MRQAQAWQPFLNNGENLLRLALTCRESGIPASRRLGIRDEVLGLDLDYAVSLRLLLFENERDKQRARLIAYEVSKLFGTEDDVLDDLHPFITNDPFADKDTQIM